MKTRKLEETEWKRECPYCGRTKYYANERGLNRALERNSRCSSCCQEGKQNPFYGKHHSEEWIEHLKTNGPMTNPETRLKVSIALTGRRISEEQKEILRAKAIEQWKRQRADGYTVPPITEKTRSNMSEAQLLRWKRQKEEGYKMPPATEEARRNRSRGQRLRKTREIKERGITSPMNYNPLACKRIDEYGKKHEYDFQTAETGGEYFIKKLGRWLDGYDKERNTAIEYYEKWHRNQEKEDKKRQEEIMDFLECDFIILKEEDYED